MDLGFFLPFRDDAAREESADLVGILKIDLGRGMVNLEGFDSLGNGRKMIEAYGLAKNISMTLNEPNFCLELEPNLCLELEPIL